MKSKILGIKNVDLLSQEQIDWCIEFFNFRWSVSENGKILAKNISFDNKKHLIKSFPIEFENCETFSCSECVNLKSLKGAPRIVDQYFSCWNCNSLTSLKYAPIDVGGFFDCSTCVSLKSFVGIPKRIGGDFYSRACNSLNSLNGIKKTKFEKEIFFPIQLIRKYERLLKTTNTFKMWQKSKLTPENFLEKYDGFIDGQNYGI